MKFSLKVFLSTLLLAALAFAACGYLLIDRSFQATLERERQLALEENQLLRFSLQTAAAGVPGELTDTTVFRIAQSMADTDQLGRRLLRLSDDEDKSVLYASTGIPFDQSLLEQAVEGVRVSQIIRSENGESWFLHVACLAATDQRNLYLESFRDISAVFAQRDMIYGSYRMVALVGLFLLAAAMYGLARLLTWPISRLSGVTRRFAAGDYSLRVAKAGNDEIGLLTRNFNTMADSLEQKIGDLEDAARQKEDFIASFAHELKTPLTAVIGYADLLRSRNLGEEARFKAASYIYAEGKRLESLSLKLLDLIVLHRQDFPMKRLPASLLLQRAFETAIPSMMEAGLQLEKRCEDAFILAEPDLMQTLLINLCDNARKASKTGGRVWLFGSRRENMYCFTVQDEGVGMSEKVRKRAIEPFYMADKSRARAQNGAGLGLSLCAEIAALHNGRLELDSRPGVGTAARCILPIEGGEDK